MMNAKTKGRNLCALLLLAATLSSCGTLLDTLLGYDECAYPGCNRSARKGSAYCAHHDPGVRQDNINKSLERMRERNRSARP